MKGLIEREPLACLFIAFVLLTAAGTGYTARQILTAAPGAVSVSGVAASEGTSTALARADHAHSLTGNLPVANLNSGTNASSTTCWRGDGTWGDCASNLPSATGAGRRQFIWGFNTVIDTTFNIGPGQTKYGAGTFVANPLTERMALLFSVTAAAGDTDGSITTNAIARRNWLPKFSTIMRVQGTTSRGHNFAFEDNAGTCNMSGGSAQITLQAGSSSSCTSHFAGIYQDARGTSPTHFLCCSGDGTTATCSDSTTIVNGTDYTLVVDLSTPAQLSCTINGVSTVKSTNLPGAAISMKANVMAWNTAGSGASGPIVSGMTLEQAF